MYVYTVLNTTVNEPPTNVATGKRRIIHKGSISGKYTSQPKKN
jgi:hypothetical protein